MLGGALPFYGLYPAADGWIAVAALEPHFAQRLAAQVGTTAEELRERFAGESAALETAYWASASVRSFTAGGADLGSVASVAEASGLMKTMIEFDSDVILAIFFTFAMGFVIIVIPMGLITTWASRKWAVRR